jgi:chromosome segregation ATPase
MSSINTCNCDCVEECHEHCQRVLDQTDGFAADLAEVSDSLCNYVQVHEHEADVDRLGAVIEQVQDEARDTLKCAENSIHETESLRGDLEQLSANCADFVSESELDNALQTLHVRNDQIEGSIQDLDARTAGAEHLASACKERLDAFDDREFFLDQQTAELKGELHHLHSTTADLVQAIADNVYTALSSQLSRILRNEDSIHSSLLTHQFHADTSNALWSAHVDLDRNVEDRLREHKEEIRTQQLQI